MRVRWISQILVVILACMCLPLQSTADNGNADLKDALEARFGLTKVSWDKVRVTDPGTVYVLKAEGINADRATDVTTLVNKVVNGKVEQPKGFAAELFSKRTTKQMNPGDRLYLTRIDIKDHGILLWFISTETSEYMEKGSSRQVRFRAVLFFPLPDELMAAGKVNEIEKVIDPIVQSEATAKAANTKTVSMGQTPDEVKAAVGAPDKIIQLGAKEIYVYKDMKVIFMDNKVSDVQ